VGETVHQVDVEGPKAGPADLVGGEPVVTRLVARVGPQEFGIHRLQAHADPFEPQGVHRCQPVGIQGGDLGGRLDAHGETGGQRKSPQDPVQHGADARRPGQERRAAAHVQAGQLVGAGIQKFEVQFDFSLQRREISRFGRVVVPLENGVLAERAAPLAEGDVDVEAEARPGKRPAQEVPVPLRVLAEGPDGLSMGNGIGGVRQVVVPQPGGEDGGRIGTLEFGFGHPEQGMFAAHGTQVFL